MSKSRVAGAKRLKAGGNTDVLVKLLHRAITVSITKYQPTTARLTRSSTQPNFMPEFQGGSYNPWGGPQGGCPGDIGADFANLFYRNLIYQRVSAISLYMLFGGTSWGWHAAPVVGE